MKLLTKGVEKRLLANNAVDGGEIGHVPVVKFFTPDAQCTWLITDMDSTNLMFGLCDLGLGTPELGYVALEDLNSLRGKMGLPVERDQHFTFDKTVGEYAEIAREKGMVVT